MNVDRRQALRLAALGTLAPLLASRPARASAAPRFFPPPAPMLYSRRLERTMADGAVFTVSRSFTVRFVSTDAGYRVEGEQAEVTVEAPAKLEKFAALERERRELGLFPLTLDRQGHIYGARASIDTAELDAAVREALSRFERSSPHGAERAELDRFVTALHQSAAKLVTELPQDLFAPSAPVWSTTRDVALPDGETGVVTVRFTASADPLTGLMQHARREVMTAMAEDRRRTVETWRLGLLDAPR